MGFDVFNALDLMENKQFLEALKFGIGDGNLQYYLYNWRCPSMVPEKVRSWFAVECAEILAHVQIVSEKSLPIFLLEFATK